jgi:Amt family ammonium transporter
MNDFKKRALLVAGLGLATLASAEPALAQTKVGTGALPATTSYVLGTFSFLLFGALVMWMAAGFTMLETGMVRTKNTSAICLKNIALFSIAGLMFYLIGYDLMYPGGNAVGILGLDQHASENLDLALLAGNAPANVVAEVVAAGHSKMSDWFFQMVFVATAASIISGTLAERVRVGPFLIFIVVLTGLLYPITGNWIWGGGWLAEMGFKDFAGATVVHSVGGWCALTGAIILGARKGKYEAGGVINEMPGANLSLATLGTFILWFGWFGFNAGSYGKLGSAADAAWLGLIFSNTTLAAASGVVVAMMFRQMFTGKLDLPFTLNGAIAGLVAITAGPDLVNPLYAVIIGGVGGALVVVAMPLFERLRVDDVVGAISAHLVAGIWGTLAVAIFGTGNMAVQLVGIGAVAGFTIVASTIVWVLLRLLVGIRVSDKAELMGMDKAELKKGEEERLAKEALAMETFPELSR